MNYSMFRFSVSYESTLCVSLRLNHVEYFPPHKTFSKSEYFETSIVYTHVCQLSVHSTTTGQILYRVLVLMESSQICLDSVSTSFLGLTLLFMFMYNLTTISLLLKQQQQYMDIAKHWLSFDSPQILSFLPECKVNCYIAFLSWIFL